MLPAFYVVFRLRKLKMSIWDILLAGGALMLVFEGIMPFVSPVRWRQAMRQALALSDGQLRFVGLLAMIAGLLMLYFIV